MLVLDENVPGGQRLLLRKWRVRFPVIGMDVASWWTTDENLIPALQSLPRPTFFTLDRNFYRRDWVHRGYSWDRWMGHIFFPLTPAFSPEERENGPPSPGYARDVFCQANVRTIRASRGLFPLPEGEGQGEGKRRLDSYRVSHFHGTPQYCLVWLDVSTHESAAYIRRFLRHPEFNTRMKRIGNVVRLHPGGIGYWRRAARGWQTVEWPYR